MLKTRRILAWLFIIAMTFSGVNTKAAALDGAKDKMEATDAESQTSEEEKEAYQTAILAVEAEELAEVITEASALNAVDYSVESWMALQMAINAAKEALTAATVEEIQTAKETLIEARNGLQGTIRTYAKASASYASGTTMENINDGDIETFWNGWGDDSLVGGKISQWVMYDFGKMVVDLTGVVVNWYDDGGGVIVPTGIIIEYDRNGKWTPVTPTEEYTFTAASNNIYPFESVKTSRIRMTMTNAAYGQWCGASIYEWDLIGKFAEGKANLTVVIEETKRLTEADYSTKSWAKLAQTLADAEAIIADREAAQDMIDAQISALTESMEVLIRKDTPIREWAKLTASYAYGNTLETLRDDSREGYDFWNGWGDSSLVDGKISQWVMYDFGEEEVDITKTIVNWSADGSGTLLPTTLAIEYDKNGIWTSVTPTNDYEISTGDDVAYKFEKITTSKLRMTMTNAAYHGQCGAAIYEWDVIGELSSQNVSGDTFSQKAEADEAKLILDKRKCFMRKGEVYKIAVKSYESAADNKLVYTSDKKGIATVSSTGVVVAHRKGTAKIMVKTSDGRKAAVTIRVIK
ncbi:MAG: discoidin domain-containing protein [Lachnospiraceae bacterium]|nr:discoidin domain-containing protein [Lachnospiraceae bacterium]